MTSPTTENDQRCRIAGPYLPVGDTDWECRTHGVLAELIDPAKRGGVVRREDLFCPVAAECDRGPCFLGRDHDGPCRPLVSSPEGTSDG